MHSSTSNQSQPQSDGSGLSGSSAAANRAFEEYLRENVVAANTLRSMRPIIAEFLARAYRGHASKCIDGRVHGSKGKGFPPTSITFSRTEGNNVDLGNDNTTFWTRMNSVVLDAKHNTPGMPAVFLALGHCSSGRYGHKHGCAAHNGNDEAALNAVRTQASTVRSKYTPEDLFVLYGMTDTDDMAECLYFSDGTILDTATIIAELTQAGTELKQPSDVFQEEFLTRQIDDVATKRYVNGLAPQDLLKGAQAPMYRDLQTALAMEAYLIKEISQISEDKPNQLIKGAVIDKVQGILGKVKGLPESLKGPFLYQSIWNIAYTLYQRTRLDGMKEEERDLHLDHAETMVCYGEGFEMLPRNKAVLAKTGRGNDIDALTVAKKVLLNNRKNHPQAHPPLVHINAEVVGRIESWDTFNAQALSKIATMTQTIFDVFGDDVCILKTYSYKDQKQFFPVRTEPVQVKSDPRICYPENIAANLQTSNLTSSELAVRERMYGLKMLEQHAKN